VWNSKFTKSDETASFVQEGGEEGDDGWECGGSVVDFQHRTACHFFFQKALEGEEGDDARESVVDFQHRTASFFFSKTSGRRRG